MHCEIRGWVLRILEYEFVGYSFIYTLYLVESGTSVFVYGCSVSSA